MWTPKRVLLLLSGFAAFISAYVVYAFWLGGIDGLPPLPRDYQPPEGNVIDPSAENPRPTPEAERKLEHAFGPGWKEELKCNLWFEVRARNLVLATKDLDFQPDGRVRIAPFNVAIFGKEEPARAPEINTIRSEVALLTFDKPVRNLAELDKRKVVLCELVENIRIRNNRRTPRASNDDVSLMTPGPLFYHEDKHTIYTPAEVRLVDEQTKPKPSEITAVGMTLNLCTEPEAKPGPRVQAPQKPKSQSISGVESIHLLATVEMHLWVESSGFLGGNTEPAPKPSEPNTEIPKLWITTQGPFHYFVSPDEEKAPDRAVFELPAQPSQLPEKVTVTRIAGPKPQEKRDQLHCDRLELTFRRKADAAAPQQEGRSVNLAIQDAHATGRQVELHSDTDMLDASGDDFLYDARTKQSTLKGTPEMWALKDGHEIFARELQIDTGQRDVHQARARGPGRIHMLDRATGKRNLHAGWTEGLDFNKDGPHDCLTLRGNAVFEDTENQQNLQADTLKVWLQPAEPNAPATAEPQKLRPHHLKANGNVRALSQDLKILDPTEELTIWFKDAPARQAPAAAPKSVAAPAVPPGVPPAPPWAEKQAASEPIGPSLTRGLVPNPNGNKNKKPLELKARSVETHVVRTGERNDLERVWCQGNVHVHQEPATPEDRGVDISGDTLHLTHSPEGSVLVVTGNLGRVQLNKITIMGPKVEIDQKLNTARVDGNGAMQMLTEKSFQGEKLEKATELTVHWNESMFFTGQIAHFVGRVQAEQNNSKLLCEEMQAFLDRPVSFKEGEKGGQSASVRDLVCDKKVHIDDEQREGAQFLRRTRLVAPSVALNKEDGVLDASGPGKVFILQFGDKEGTAPGAAPAQPVAKKNDKGEKELTLTRIEYQDKFRADDKPGSNNKSRMANFFGDVDVVNLPAESIDHRIDVDNKLPAGAMHLHCERLQILTQRHADGRTTQEMEGHRKVVIESQEFWGRADVVKYDEAKQLVILEAGANGVATIHRTTVQAGELSTMSGKKILYYRKTNQVNVDGATGINFNP